MSGWVEKMAWKVYNDVVLIRGRVKHIGVTNMCLYARSIEARVSQIYVPTPVIELILILLYIASSLKIWGDIFLM